MRNKIIWTFVIIIMILVIGLSIWQCSNGKQAAIDYCGSIGGEYVQEPYGGKLNNSNEDICVMPHKTCNLWDLFRGDC